MPASSPRNTGAKPEIFRFRKFEKAGESEDDRYGVEEQAILQTFYKRRLEEIFTQLKKIEKGPQKKAIHKFRLAVKKLRAERALVEYVLNRKAAADKNLRPVKQIYKASGAERDLQMQLALLPTYGKRIGGIFNSLIKDLNGKEIAAAENLKQTVHLQFPLIKRHPSSRYLRDLKKADLQNVLSCTMDFISEQLSLIAFESRKAAGAHSLHEIRKILKKVFYMTRLLDRYNVPGRKRRRNQLAKYDLLQEALGDWHDLLQLETVIPDVEDFKGLRASIRGDRELLELAAYGLLEEI